MSLSNAATYFDELWQGTSKADKYSAKNGKTFLIVGFGGNDTLNGANKSDKIEGKEGNDKSMVPAEMTPSGQEGT